MTETMAVLALANALATLWAYNRWRDRRKHAPPAQVRLFSAFVGPAPAEIAPPKLRSNAEPDDYYYAGDLPCSIEW